VARGGRATSEAGAGGTPFTPFQERFGRFTIQCLTALNTVVYRLSDGRVAGSVPGGAPICLLSTTGRRTGRRRTVALLYLPFDDGIVVVASRGGMSSHPAWYLNLLADPRVEVQMGEVTRRGRARRATEEERAVAWPALVAVYERFETYRLRTDRTIPVVVVSFLDG
jgi:deazaflavin-dependent oxidoreductase (nitroreductase family)